MRNRLSGSAAAALLTLVMLGGCAGLGKPLETPRISLANIQVQESKGLETAFLVHLRVMNPNDVDLDIRGVDCDLEINDKPFAYGISNTAVTVPAFGSALAKAGSTVRLLMRRSSAVATAAAFTLSILTRPPLAETSPTWRGFSAPALLRAFVGCGGSGGSSRGFALATWL